MGCFVIIYIFGFVYMMKLQKFTFGVHFILLGPN